MTPRANVFDTLDVILHRRKRKIISQAIAERSMRTFEPIMTEQVDIFVKQLLMASRTPEPLDMTHQCQNLAGDIVGHLSFGYPLHLQTEDTNRWLLSGLSLVSAMVNIYMQLPAFYVMEPALKFLGRRIRQKYLQITELMIRSRLAQEKNAKHDLYSFAIDSMGGGNSLKDSELWAEAFFFIVAGGSTTTTAMSALFFYLSRNPTVYDKLTSEIRSTFQSGAEIQSGSQLQKCVYLRACINEVLRMATPNTATLWREQSEEETPETLKPLVIDGCVIPRGTQVGVNLYSLHHNEDYFPDPFSFRPERWLSSPGYGPDDQATLLHKAFAPFSVGTRSCPGKAVAFLEITLTLAKTLWYFDFKTAPGALGQQGAGVHGKKGGRGRQNEYQLYDTFTASHSGPFLVFQKRDGFGEELET
ncbi:cytochrome P450 3A31 [Seiridium cupressi]